MASLLLKKWQEFRPVWKVGKQGKWTKLAQPACLAFGEEKEVNADFEFTIDFDNSQTPVYFATCFPFSHAEVLDYLDILDMRMKGDSNVYYNRELLTYSYEGRRLDLLTISSFDGIEEDLESISHPVMFLDNDNKSSARRFVPEKKVVLLTGRVHPGETPSSHAIQGAIDLLTHPSNPIALALREHFVFKIVPMLNPDGVHRGHFRTDSMLQDLNRFYDHPDEKIQSNVFAVKELLAYLSEEKRLVFFCDYHSHNLPRNCYFYGNFLKYSLQVETMTFSRLMEINCPEFSLNHCDFSFKSMGFGVGAKNKNKNKKNGKTGKGKKACSRVAAFRKTAVIHSFTFEIGYHGDIFKSSSIKQSSNTCSEGTSVYTIEDLHRIGQSLLHSLLDLYGVHPFSKLPSTDYKSIENIRLGIAHSLKKEYCMLERDLEKQFKNINQIIEDHYSSKPRKDDQKIKTQTPQVLPQTSILQIGAGNLTGSIAHGSSRRSHTSLNITIKKTQAPAIRPTIDQRDISSKDRPRNTICVNQKPLNQSVETSVPAINPNSTFTVMRIMERNEIFIMDHSNHKLPGISPDPVQARGLSKISEHANKTQITQKSFNEIGTLKPKQKGFEIKKFEPKV